MQFPRVLSGTCKDYLTMLFPEVNPPRAWLLQKLRLPYQENTITTISIYFDLIIISSTQS